MSLPEGVFPTMITPFTAEGAVDYRALDALVEWYITCGCTGLFAVCQSSEMYNLTPDERIEVASRVVAKAAGRVPVVASGTFGGSIEEQAAFVNKMGTIVTAVVVLVNQMAEEGESEEVWMANTQQLLAKTGSVPLGLYECPKPYHRLLEPATLGWCAGTGRFLFHKDTHCQKGPIESKLKSLPEGSDFRFYNANVATLRFSLQRGGAGFSGISANFYPQLLAWLCRNVDHADAEYVQDFLSVAENVVMYKYPTSAKAYLALFPGFEAAITTKCRANDNVLNEEENTKLVALRALAARLCEKLSIPVLNPADYL